MLTAVLEHPMCHAKKLSALHGLFEGFRNEVFKIRFFAPVENCAAGKMMNRESLKKIPLVAEKSQTNKNTRDVSAALNFSTSARLQFAPTLKNFSPHKYPANKGPSDGPTVQQQKIFSSALTFFGLE
jgi:hypothetical protein